MSLPVTAGAKRNQVGQCIVAELASPVQMMCLQVFWRTATLTPPSIAFEHPVSERIVFLKVELQPRSFLTQFPHLSICPVSPCAVVCEEGGMALVLESETSV
jgi:hypothetical protein